MTISTAPSPNLLLPYTSIGVAPSVAPADRVQVKKSKRLDEAGTCDLCALCRTAKNIKVGGRGSSAPNIMIVGEAPNWQEDRGGKSFVGDAGALLDEILLEAQVDRSKVRWTNLVRCIPRVDPRDPRKGVRPPSWEEFAHCSGYLFEEINATKPRVIVVMGATGLEKLLRFKGGPKRARARQIDEPFSIKVGDTTYPVIVTYHPAYVLRGGSTHRADIVRDLTLANYLLTNRRLRVYTPTLTMVKTNVEAVELIDRIIEYHRTRKLPHGCVSYDIESTTHDPKMIGLDPWNDQFNLGGLALSYADDSGFYLPLDVKDSPLDYEALKPDLRRLFETVPTTAHQSKFDSSWILAKLGVLPLQKHCTLIASHIVYGEKRTHGLKDLGIDLLGATDWEKPLDEWKKTTKSKDYGDIPLPIMEKYGAMDGAVGHALMGPLLEGISDYNLWGAYARAMELTREFVEIEHRGAFVDLAFYQGMCERYVIVQRQAKDRLQSLPIVQRYTLHLKDKAASTRVKPEAQQKIRDATEFNPGSDEQCASVIFYERCGDASMKMDGAAVGGALVTRGESTTQYVTGFFGFCSAPSKYTETGAASSDESVVSGLFKESETVCCALAGLLEPEKYSKAQLIRKLGYMRDAYFGVEGRYGDAVQLHYHIERMEFLIDLREYSKVTKAITGYLTSLPNFIRKDQRCRDFQTKGLGVLNFVYLLEGTRTGRVSTQKFPLHTTPSGRSELKRMFVSEWMPEGGLILQMDFSQLELRVLAAVTGDPGLIQAYIDGYDLHTYVASFMFQKAMEEVTSQERSYSKGISFGLVYGQSVEAAAEIMGVSVQRAQGLFDEYFRRFPGVYTWIEDMHKHAQDHGYVRYPTGRIRWILNNKAGRGKRQAQNAPIQGAASEMVSDALMLTQKGYRRAGMHSRVWGWVHDSIEADTKPGEVYAAYTIMKKAVEKDVLAEHPWCKVPLKGDFELGSRWGTPCGIESFEPVDGRTWRIEVEGKVPFVDELVEFLRRGHVVHEVLDAEPERDLPEEELLPKQAYVGDSGGDYSKKTEITFSYGL